MLGQHMVTPGAILWLFGGYKMLVFLFVFFFKEILCWISQVHIIELPSGFLREQPCNHKLPSSNTVILHVQNGLVKSRFLNNTPQWNTGQYTVTHCIF